VKAHSHESHSDDLRLSQDVGTDGVGRASHAHTVSLHLVEELQRQHHQPGDTSSTQKGDYEGTRLARGGVEPFAKAAHRMNRVDDIDRGCVQEPLRTSRQAVPVNLRRRATRHEPSRHDHRDSDHERAGREPWVLAGRH
jgi:hypothetical protein